MAIATVALDTSKADVYAEALIPEYWVVRPEVRAVDVYREPSGDGYLFRRTLTEQERLITSSLAGVEFSVAEILPDSR